MSNVEIFIEEDDFQIIENKLEALFQKVEASATLLVDKNGFLILAKGEFPHKSPEDVSVMASAAFTAINQMMNATSDAITVSFPSRPDETLRCHILRQNMFLILLIKNLSRDDSEREERILRAARSFLKDIDGIFFS